MLPCPKCKAEVPANENYCPRCFEPVERPKRPGWWRRLRNALFGLPATIQLGSAATFTGFQRIEYVDPATGQRKQVDSLEQVPTELRRQLEALRRQVLQGQGNTTFVFRDFTGLEHSYQSLNEMPPELRALCEQIRKVSGIDSQTMGGGASPIVSTSPTASSSYDAG